MFSYLKVLPPLNNGDWGSKPLSHGALEDTLDANCSMVFAISNELELFMLKGSGGQACGCHLSVPGIGSSIWGGQRRTYKTSILENTKISQGNRVEFLGSIDQRKIESISLAHLQEFSSLGYGRSRSWCVSWKSRLEERWTWKPWCLLGRILEQALVPEPGKRGVRTEEWRGLEMHRASESSPRARCSPGVRKAVREFGAMGRDSG